MSDWADELAETLAKEASQLDADSALIRDVWAARLRLVRQEGVSIGLDQAQAAIARANSQTIQFPNVSAEGFIEGEENPQGDYLGLDRNGKPC